MRARTAVGALLGVGAAAAAYRRRPQTQFDCNDGTTPAVDAAEASASGSGSGSGSSALLPPAFAGGDGDGDAAADAPLMALARLFIVSGTTAVSKLVLHGLNDCHISADSRRRMRDAALDRPRGRALITVSNHTCTD